MRSLRLNFFIGILGIAAHLFAEPITIAKGQWRREQDRAHADLLILKDGTKLSGHIRDLPQLKFLFGGLPLEIDDISFLAVIRSHGVPKLEIRTWEDLTFVCAIPEERIALESHHSFVSQSLAQEIKFQTIDRILMQKRKSIYSQLSQNLFYLELKNGDCVPVVIGDKTIALHDGWDHFILESEQIVELEVDEGVFGTIIDETGSEIEFEEALVQQKRLHVQVYKSGQTVPIPWDQIQRIRRVEKNLATTDRFENRLEKDASLDNLDITVDELAAKLEKEKKFSRQLAHLLQSKEVENKSLFQQNRDLMKGNEIEHCRAVKLEEAIQDMQHLLKREKERGDLSLCALKEKEEALQSYHCRIVRLEKERDDKNSQYCALFASKQLIEQKLADFQNKIIRLSEEKCALQSLGEELFDQLIAMQKRLIQQDNFRKIAEENLAQLSVSQKEVAELRALCQQLQAECQIGILTTKNLEKARSEESAQMTQELQISAEAKIVLQQQLSEKEVGICALTAWLCTLERQTKHLEKQFESLNNERIQQERRIKQLDIALKESNTCSQGLIEKTKKTESELVSVSAAFVIEQEALQLIAKSVFSKKNSLEKKLHQAKERLAAKEIEIKALLTKQEEWNRQVSDQSACLKRHVNVIHSQLTETRSALMQVQKKDQIKQARLSEVLAENQHLLKERDALLLQIQKEKEQLQVEKERIKRLTNMENISPAGQSLLELARELEQSANAFETDFTTQTLDSAIRDIHTVAEGENLNNISMKYYGTPARWCDIYDANADLITDVKKLKVGSSLLIPE